MEWIGITGGLASGKSTALNYLKKLGMPVLSADRIVSDLLKPGSEGYDPVIKLFGVKILDREHKIDNLKLADIVFRPGPDLSRLEGVLHPMVRRTAEKFRDICVREGHWAAFYEIPLLFEKKLKDQFDRTLLIYCDKETQIKRFCERTGASKYQAERRILSQLPMSEKRLQADDVIENANSLEEFYQKLDDYLRSLKKGSKMQ